MLRITRGVLLHHNSKDMTIAPGPGFSLDMSQKSFTLWFTFAGPAPKDSGMIVNVANISKALRQELSTHPIVKHSAEDILDWAWQTMNNKFPACNLTRLTMDLHENLSLTRYNEELSMIYLTTKYELAAAHQLWNEEWDQQKNFDMFGKCSNPSGHGHNYFLEITLKGQPNPESGTFISPDKVDQIVKDYIIEPFDHKNLNVDTPEFTNCVPTVENMVKIFFDILKQAFTPTQLHCVKIWETPKTFAEYYGPDED